MSAAFVSPERVPIAAAERLLANLSGLVALVETALDAVPDGATAGSTAPSPARLRRLLKLLQDEQRALRDELERFATNDREPLLHHAAALCTLARRMDGYDLHSAGEAAAAGLVEQRRLLVLVAWQIAAAASGSPGAGL